MKYILGPFFKYLWLIIQLTLQILLAIIITIVWLIPTLIFYILYFIFVSLWEFKLKYYKFSKYHIRWSDDSISHTLLWSDQNVYYDNYFYTIWNIQNKQKTINKILNFLNL